MGERRKGEDEKALAFELLLPQTRRAVQLTPYVLHRAPSNSLAAVLVPLSG